MHLELSDLAANFKTTQFENLTKYSQLIYQNNNKLLNCKLLFETYEIYNEDIFDL